MLAHNIHADAAQIQRVAARQATIAHCPCSNAVLGSGNFPMRRHLDGNARFSLGTDIGAGTGFGIIKETLQAYLMQRVALEPMTLTAATQMLWMANARVALRRCVWKKMRRAISRWAKPADLVFFRPPTGSTLHAVLASLEDPERILSALLTLAGPHCVYDVRVEGDSVYEGIP